MEVVIAAFLLLLAVVVWIPTRKPGLNFSQADIQFLFPAPFTRAELIRYRLLRSQIGVLFGSAFMTLVFRPSSMLGGGWMVYCGILLLMTFLNLYFMGAGLNRTTLSSQGVSRQWLPLVIVIGAAAVVVGTVVLDWPKLAALPTGTDVGRELLRLATTGPAAIVLWPFRTVAHLPFSPTPSAFFATLPPALLILALIYVWVITSKASFEEGSVDFAERIARARKGQRPTGPNARSVAPTPFKLSLEGRPEMAILWKNLIYVSRYVSLKTLVVFLPLFVIFATLIRGGSRGGVGEALAIICLVSFIFTILAGPQVARNDLREDLVNLAVLRTWPVTGATLVRGEVMAPAALLTAIAWLCALGGMLFGKSAKIEPSWAAAAFLLSPGVILIRVLVQNAIAVMWPAWSVMTPGRARGIEVMGLRVISLVGLLVVLFVALLPAALVAGVVGVAIYALTGVISVLLPAAAAAVVLLAESYVASEAIGKMLDRTDVHALDAQE